MLDDDDIPAEGVFTDQWIWGRRAKVWFQKEVMLAFPRVEDRLPILQALEATMIGCGTAELFYHMERMGDRFVLYESAEDEGCIYVNVRIGAPIAVPLLDGPCLN
jgi:hypothetical protein